MKTGMMWFDNDPKTTLEVKIQQATDYYLKKYGRMPDLCLVNPSGLGKADLESEARQVGKVLIRPLRLILPGHLWIGVDEKGANDGHENV